MYSPSSVLFQQHGPFLLSFTGSSPATGGNHLLIMTRQAIKFALPHINVHILWHFIVYILGAYPPDGVWEALLEAVVSLPADRSPSRDKWGPPKHWIWSLLCLENQVPVKSFMCGPLSSCQTQSKSSFSDTNDFFLHSDYGQCWHCDDFKGSWHLGNWEPFQAPGVIIIIVTVKWLLWAQRSKLSMSKETSAGLKCVEFLKDWCQKTLTTWLKLQLTVLVTVDWSVVHSLG